MSKPPPVAKFGVQATFDPLAYSQFIQFHGLDYQWSRAVECPCRLNSSASRTNQWDPTCKRCGGDGWMYVNPCAQTEQHKPGKDFTGIKGIFSTVATDPSIIETFGPFLFGDAQLTVENEVRLSYRDRFIGIQQEIGFTELLVRGDGDIVPVGKTGRPRTEQVIAMRYEPRRVNYIEDDDGSGGRTVYFHGPDFTVSNRTQTEPQKLVWQPGQGPPIERHYTVHYDIHPVWIVDSGVYAAQNSKGPVAGLKGPTTLQLLPTTFKVKLDWLTPKRGT